MKYNKISFCTVCMNRAMHLKETLPRNIHDNRDYNNIEFVLLDYGSKDDLYSWAQDNLRAYIDAGILTYFSTKDPQYFHMSHSKNMAFRLATGDIICSVDADNFTGAGFATYVNEMFNKDTAIFLAPPRIGPDKKWWDVQGRLCLRKDDFYYNRGYDEQVTDYGYEDQDLKSRLEQYGRRRTCIHNPAYLQAIRHDDHMRIAEGISVRKTKDLFIAPVDEQVSEVIYLQENNVFERFYVSNDPLQYKAAGVQFDAQPGNNYLLKPRRRYAGTYRTEGNTTWLMKENEKIWMILANQPQGHLLAADKRLFYRVDSCDLRETFLLERAIHLGKKIYMQNRKHAHIINPQGFGAGKVYRNFSAERIILEEVGVS
ncbi:glycosyltransferase family A protein [Chitinophaga nivalis]|uniref:Glycosyltransferase family 2 protein n=1 Tax=Chitinophaga nivalis TaxID=2991709 RepID=A0ABT3IV03_9BACT|nr:glycosyltransferase family A protein [Chitinophaga nivalis]MCW3462593.1 glycosyltransferase family 2 protein [Chitinophaga nivalis]MCW3487716.1 glycosyltransferase family 2 protein [Chitinophaga nivalis]